MEPYYAGWMSLLPPVPAIVLALITKEVISSLLPYLSSETSWYNPFFDLSSFLRISLTGIEPYLFDYSRFFVFANAVPAALYHYIAGVIAFSGTPSAA